MQADAGRAWAVRADDDDLHRTTRRLRQLPESCGAAVAQCRSGAAGEDGGELAGARAEDGMAHRIDPAMHGLEPPGRQPTCDPSPRDSRSEQLGARDHAQLAAGEVGDHPIVGVHDPRRAACDRRCRMLCSSTVRNPRQSRSRFPYPRWCTHRATVAHQSPDHAIRHRLFTLSGLARVTALPIGGLR